LKEQHIDYAKDKFKGMSYIRITSKCESKTCRTQRVSSKNKACGMLVFKSESKACEGNIIEF
jgi:hypothetical protein